MGSNIRKELDWILHDRLSIAILFILPMFLFFLIGGGSFTITDPEDTPVIYILDQDQTPTSMAYIENFKSDNFELTIYDSINNPEIATLERCEELIDSTQLDAYIIIPAHFSEELLTNMSSTLYMYIDSLTDAKLTIEKSFSYGNLVFQLNYQVFNGEIVYFPEFRPDAEISFIISMMPVLISMILFECMNMVASQSIISDDPLKRMLLSPVRKREVVISKFLAYAFLGAILAFVSIFILWFFFNAPFANFFNTYLVSLNAALFGASFGILFSCLSTSRLQAAQMSIFIFVLQFMLVLFLRLDVLVDFMPMEIVRASFVSVAFRNTPIIEMTQTVIFSAGIHCGVLLLAIWVYNRKKEAV